MWIDPFTESQWVLSCIWHQEGWCCQPLAGAGCEAAAAFLAHLKDGFDYTSWGRCWEVSCFSWPVRDVSCLFVCRLVWHEYPFPSTNRSRMKGWQEKNEIHVKKTRWLICPCKIALPFHLLKHAPQTQLVNVKQLTRLWYKLINDTQLAWRERGEKKKGEHMISSIKEKKRELCDIMKYPTVRAAVL